MRLDVYLLELKSRVLVQHSWLSSEKQPKSTRTIEPKFERHLEQMVAGEGKPRPDFTTVELHDHRPSESICRTQNAYPSKEKTAQTSERRASS
jgi:hypothetical protein